MALVMLAMAHADARRASLDISKVSGSISFGLESCIIGVERAVWV